MYIPRSTPLVYLGEEGIRELKIVVGQFCAALESVRPYVTLGAVCKMCLSNPPFGWEAFLAGLNVQ